MLPLIYIKLREKKMTVFLRPNLLLAHSWRKTKISDIILLEKGLKTTKPSSVLEPQKSMNKGNRGGF
jgi:hypothetical protein